MWLCIRELEEERLHSFADDFKTASEGSF